MMTYLNKENYDFSCWVIKYGRKSVDNLIYQKDCLKFEGKLMVPLVWNYQNWTPDSVLGMAILEHRDEGVYAYCKFNESENGTVAKQLIEVDTLWLGPYVTRVKIDNGYVTQGLIRSVSLIIDRVDPDDCYKPVLRNVEKKDESYIDEYNKALDDVISSFESWADIVKAIRRGPAFFTLENIRDRVEQLRKEKEN